jgi:dTDP-4-amino-4,6-dideoxygalactose transaminase
MSLKVPFIDLAPQHKLIRGRLRSAVQKVLDSQRFILGEECRAFEREAARFLGVKHAIGVASGTDALILSLAALGVREGDEVITTPFSFFATASSVLRLGAKPVFCDIEDETLNIDPKKIEAKITRRTRALLPVHLFGRACRMDEILRVARRRGLAVVEDAAQSFGASYKGRMTGSFGDAGCFSFYPTKNLGGAGDGGLITTNSSKLDEKLRLLRDHGSRKKYVHELLGWNSRLDELQAAVLRVKLRALRRWNAARQKHARAYNAAFKGLPVGRPVDQPGAASIHHLYTLRTLERDALAAHLTARGVGNAVYYPVPLHRQPCFNGLKADRAGYPVSERASQEALSLPMFAELTVSQRNAVIRAVRGFFGK